MENDANKERVRSEKNKKDKFINIASRIFNSIYLQY